MRIVICSDIHGNVVALEAVLAQIARDDAPDALFVAGDLVLFGPRPAETMARLRALPQARFVKGNTDHYLVDRSSDDEDVKFARARLSEDDMTFLADLPFEQRLEVAPGHGLLVVHANPRDLEQAIKPDTPEAILRPLLETVDAEVLAFGHYHVPFVRQLDQLTLVDVGSVGMPRDGDRRAAYAVLTWDGRHWQIEHRRVPFAIEAVAQDLVTVGYPDAADVARRLLAARYGYV